MKKVLAATVAALVVLAFGWAHRDQVEARTNCADKIVHQYTTTSVVPGAFGCLNPSVKEALAYMYGITTDKELAAAIGNNRARYSYVQETKDGGYTYEVDVQTASRSFGDELNAIWSDVKKGDISRAWDQVNFGTELWNSTVLTVYLYPSGTNFIDANGHSIDIGGEVEAIQ